MAEMTRGSMCTPELPGYSTGSSKVVDGEVWDRGWAELGGGGSRARVGQSQLWTWEPDPIPLSQTRPVPFLSLDLHQQHRWPESEETHL